MAEILLPTDDNLKRAAAAIKAGDLVAIPTETVYGLAADATNETAVQKIYAIKGRPSYNPLIVHISTIDQAKALTDWSPQADKLAALFWPGPLTFILPLKADSGIANAVTGGLKTLAIRMPASLPMQAIIRESGKPLAAPSANPSGRLSPTMAHHVAEEIGAGVTYIIDGGPCAVGIESTILDLTTTPPTLRRPGIVTFEILASHIPGLREKPVARGESAEDGRFPANENINYRGITAEALTAEVLEIKSPGELASHYAPKTPLFLNIPPESGDVWVIFGRIPTNENHANVTILSLSESENLAEAAQNLFETLRKADQLAPKRIVMNLFRESGLGRALNDRLRRAASHPHPGAGDSEEGI